MQQHSSTSSIYRDSLRPLKLLMFLVGVVPCDCCQSARSRGLYTMLNTLWRWTQMLAVLGSLLFVFFVVLFCTREAIYQRSDILSHGMDSTSYVTLLLVNIFIKLESTWKSGQYDGIFSKFEKMRLQLAQELGVQLDCGRIRFYSLLLYALLLVYSLINVFLIMIVRVEVFASIQMLLTLYSEVLMRMKLLEFMLFAALIGAFLRELHMAGQQQIDALQRTRFAAWQERRACLARIFSLQDLHAQLWQLLRCIEDYFEWSLTVLLLKMFFDTTILGYWVFFLVEGHMPVAFKIYCIGLLSMHFVFLYVTCFICNACEQSARKFRSLFHGVANDRRNPYLGACLRRISLQLMHEPIYFTAGGYVNVNMNMFGQFIFTVILYIVILIQFRMSVWICVLCA